jgi:hypothetical protein
MRDGVRLISVVALLTALGLAVAGCGSGKAVSGSITVAGTTTISNVDTGTLVTCEDGPGAAVPAVGEGVSGFADGPPGSSSSGEIQLTRQQDGSVVATCTG